jgi:DNA polymerase-4
VYRVLQVDLDQFIAAVEVLRRPELAGSQWSSAAMETPLAAASPPPPTQPMSTASIRHAIAHGARRCPDAVFLPADNPAYKAASEDVMAVLRGFGPSAGAMVEIMGWDEAFVGVTTDTAPRGLPGGSRRRCTRRPG